MFKLEAQSGIFQSILKATNVTESPIKCPSTVKEVWETPQTVSDTWRITVYIGKLTILINPAKYIYSSF